MTRTVPEIIADVHEFHGATTTPEEIRQLAKEVERLTGELTAAWQLGFHSRDEDVERRFEHLASMWRDETFYMSDLTRICNHPTYEEIAAMGWQVVPILLRELETNPDYWFSALRKITGANPVASEMAGQLKDMAAAWIEWGKDNGVSW